MSNGLAAKKNLNFSDYPKWIKLGGGSGTGSA
jgi:hypothetical protein